jgi:hypothetical protein
MRTADMDMMIAVGFGSAYATKDGVLIYDGEQDYRAGNEPKTLSFIEEIAKAEPAADWQVILYGPLCGEIYQRQGDAKWVLIDSNEGFA